MPGFEGQERSVNQPGKAFLTQTAAPAGSAREGPLPSPQKPGPHSPTRLPARFSEARTVQACTALLAPAAPGVLGPNPRRCPRNQPSGRKRRGQGHRAARGRRTWLARGRGIRFRSRRSEQRSWFFSVWAPGPAAATPYTPAGRLPGSPRNPAGGRGRASAPLARVPAAGRLQRLRAPGRAGSRRAGLDGRAGGRGRGRRRGSALPAPAPPTLH